MREECQLLVKISPKIFTQRYQTEREPIRFDG